MQKKFFFLTAIFSFLLFSIVAANWQVAPSEDVMEYSPGDSFVVSLTLNGDGNEIDALGFDLAFPGTLLNFRRAFFEGTLLEPWMFKQTQLYSDGVLRIAGFTTTGQIQSGTSGKIVNIVFEVEASASGEGFIFPNSFTDDLAGAENDSALFRVKSSGFFVSGYVRYYNNLFPVPNVSVPLANFIGSTNSSGEFSFSQIAAGNYVIKPNKNGDIGSSVSPFDAAKILQYAAGLIELNPYQMIAADVTGNKSVSAFDAAKILQYNVGLIDSFPVGKDWSFLPFNFVPHQANWDSAPDSMNLMLLDKDTTGIDFKAIVIGDVTGNWSGGLKKQSSARFNYRIKPAQEISTKIIGVPIELNFSDVTFSGLIKIKISDQNFKFSSVEINKTGENLFFQAAERKNGVIKLAFASARSLKNQAIAILVNFEKTNSATTQVPRVQVSIAMINESKANFIGELENSSQISVSYRLEQNFPNPFNPKTAIRFFLGKENYVTLQIFNTTGQLIRTLLAERVAAGEHQIIWDGTDERGEIAASGIYFCKLHGDDFQLVKKMLFVR